MAAGSRTARIHVGTSGWHYDHWSGPFYPERMSSRAFLSFYAAHFDVVEVNNTFYRIPGPEALAAWRDATPDGFVFACKASRYITHLKKLKDPEASIARFFEAVEVLAPKLGPILFQLPPRWRRNAERLDRFLAALPGGHRYAFEFRDASWFASETYRTLARHGAAFCIFDLDRRRSPLETTADFAYVRLHGPGGAYQGSYDDDALAGWARRFHQWQGDGTDVFCFFDNDEEGYAVENARRLRRMIDPVASGGAGAVS